MSDFSDIFSSEAGIVDSAGLTSSLEEVVSKESEFSLFVESAAGLSGAVPP